MSIAQHLDRIALAALIPSTQPHGATMQTWHPNLSGIGKMAAEQNMLNDFEREEALRIYRSLLEGADWSYEQSDDAIVWRSAMNQFGRLYVMQAELDKDGSIWRSIAPIGFSVPQPRVRSAA